MKNSFSYYLILLVLKLKGVKKDFSKDPIDYKKIRREDVYSPKRASFRNHQLRNFDIYNTTITEVKNDKSANNLLLFIHGGAFISGPAKHHWDTLKKIVHQTNHIVWMCDYPKAPEHKISEISKNIDLIYAAALEKFAAQQITIIGDSVGGTLTVALVQRLVSTNSELPKKIVLISPVMDATMSNPKIDAIDETDPMLSKLGVLSAKKMCADNDDLANMMISPLYGNFKNFPKTILFLAENDITYPDQQLTVEKLTNHNIDIDVITGDRMPHIWPLLPVMKEATSALKQLLSQLNNEA